MTSSRFSRNVPGTTERLSGRCVGIAGCGGLGSNAAVALARSGLGRLVIADIDVVEESNLNRQHYFSADVGRPKVEALARHLVAINPDMRVDARRVRLEPGNLAEVFGEAEILVEAFDAAESKRWLIGSWCASFPDRYIVCGNGLSGLGRLDALRVERIGRVVFCGDGQTDMSLGLSAPRVAVVAAMQASVAVELLLE